MDIPFVIPGTTAPAITIRRTVLGGITVLADGVPVKRRLIGLRYPIPLADGTVVELKISGQWRGLKATVNGVETALEPPVSRVLVALIFLPLLLVILGGAIGAGIGGVASGVNLWISRSDMRLPAKLMSMVGATFLAVTIWFGVAFTIAPIPTLAVGNCLNGARDGAELSAADARPVSCAAVHENEVVGTLAYTQGGSFPGIDALFAFGEAPCLTAFASYVGIEYEFSVLEMILITPSDLTWAKGDRQVSCIVLAPDNGTLTGSVKGTAK